MRGNINLSPRFQRRNAWTDPRKSLFIESLIFGLPIPQIILAEDKSRRGAFVVIDGKQRLLALRQFAAKPDDTEFRQLRLAGLSDKKDLNGKTYSDFEADSELADYRNTFDNQTIRTVVIRNWKDDRYLYSVFLRINTGSVQLSAQELRQALHPGGFADFIDDFSIQSAELKEALGLTEPDFRMRDVELTLRYFAYRLFHPRYEGNLKKFLDDALIDLNNSWQSDPSEIENAADEFARALQTVKLIFGPRDQLRKWNGERYERRINRAVFDIMTFYFSEPVIAQAAAEHAEEIKQRFQTLCEKNRHFLASIESTTKSMDANRIRFRDWATQLSEALQIKVPSPF